MHMHASMLFFLYVLCLHPFLKTGDDGGDFEVGEAERQTFTLRRDLAREAKASRDGHLALASADGRDVAWSEDGVVLRSVVLRAADVSHSEPSAAEPDDSRRQGPRGLARGPRRRPAAQHHRSRSAAARPHLPKFFESRYIQVEFFKPWDGDAWHMASRFAFSFSFAPRHRRALRALEMLAHFVHAARALRRRRRGRGVLHLDLLNVTLALCVFACFQTFSLGFKLTHQPQERFVSKVFETSQASCGKG